MSQLRHLLGPVVLPALAFVALANTGCATTIAGEFPHLERRKICVHLPEDPEASEYLLTNDGTILSNFQPELVRQAAPSARIVLEFDPGADPSSVRHLPARYQDLECAPVFSMLPAIHKDTSSLPEAAVDVLVHDRRPNPMPAAITKALATCPSPNADSKERVVNIIVYAQNDGVATSAYVARSTLGAPKTEDCMLNVLRKTFWPEVVAEVNAASAVAAPIAVSAPSGAKMFFAEPAPSLPTPDTAPTSGIRIKPPALVPTPTAPATNPSGFRIPVIGVLPAVGPLIVGGLVIVGITLLPNSAAPPWLSEMNPITRLPYRSESEFRQINQLSPEQIQHFRDVYIRNSQSQPPPAPVPPPAPTLTPEQQREQEKKREKCGKLATQIKELMEAKRDPTPKGGFPQGRKGVIERWGEMARNEGKWQPRPDGSLSNAMKGHFAAYADEQEKLVKALDKWNDTKCDDKEHDLPRNARQYAAQTPEYGPGKPLEPAPLPEYRPPRTPPAIAPQSKKGSK